MLNLRTWCSKGVITVILASLIASCDAVSDDDDLVLVSLVQLLATPEKFEGKQIRVVGFLQSAGQLRLFLTRDHALALDDWSSVRVHDDTPGGSLILSDCPGHYVTITGKFDRDKGSPQALINTGIILRAIIRVDDVLRMDTVETCWQRQE